MQHADVLVVGGGPAGSTCAARLQAGGLDVLLIDKARFPREKLCAGWITPPVLVQLGLDVDAYSRQRVLQPMTGFRVGRIGGPSVTVSYPQPVSYGIRRSEFDDYLLRRSGARLELGEAAKAIRREGNRWIINERFCAPMLVAAGGHFCPVARFLGRMEAERGPLIVSQEIEVEWAPAEWSRCPIAPSVPEIYFCPDLLGYGWCIRKGSYLNLGLGRADRRRLPAQFAEFCEWLRREGRIAALPKQSQGHAYLLYGQSARPLADEAVVWVGDSAGLAYAESGEGIRPAVESAVMAAEVILSARGDYCRQSLDLYRRKVETRFGPRRAVAPREEVPSRVRGMFGRCLLGREWFVRHFVLERWFLRSGSY